MEAASYKPAIEKNSSDRLFLVGCDIAHSLSPVLHNAACKAFSLPWTYELIDESKEENARAFIESRAYRAINVTTPYKHLAKACATRLVDARDLPGINVLINDCGELVGYNTDGEGAISFLASEGVTVDSADVLVCGTGATAHAIAKAAHQAGASSVRLLSRTMSSKGVVRYDDAQLLFKGADIIVNATPVGMHADDELPFDPCWLDARHVVLDAVYGHGETPYAKAASQAGCSFYDGLGMLVGQAALTLELVIEHAGDPRASHDEIVAVMKDALRGCLKTAHALQ